MQNSTLNPSFLLKAAPVAGLIAAVINTVLYFLGDAMGFMDQTVGTPSADGIQPITLLPVIMSSIIPSIVAGLVFALLNRFTSNPFRIFGIISLVLVVLSFANPFMGIPGIPVGMGVLLNIMHVVVAGSVWVVFNRFAGRSASL